MKLRALAVVSAVPALAVFAALGGCTLARQAPDTSYYLLVPPGSPPLRVTSPIRVGRFTADSQYATAGIAHRSSPYRLEYYTYHRWAADPRALITTAVRDYLEPASGHIGVPFEIEGNVRKLEEVDSPESWDGVLVLDLKVKRGAATLVDRVYSETTPAERRNPEAVAAALSRSLGRILDHLLRDAVAAAGASRRAAKDILPGSSDR